VEKNERKEFGRKCFHMTPTRLSSFVFQFENEKKRKEKKRKEKKRKENENEFRFSWL
jgi:hypothetical protein